MKKLRPPRIKSSDFSRKLENKGSISSELMENITNLSKEEYEICLNELQDHGLIKYSAEKKDNDIIYNIEI